MSTSLVKTAPKSITLPLLWFDFDQNNSGGRFVYSDNVGLNVYIQATSAKEANSRAEDVEVYFNGASVEYEDGEEYSTGPDCPCCGDRWYEASDGEAEFPKIGMYSKAGWIKREYALMDERNGMKDGYAVFHFYDGTRQYGVPQFEADDEDTRLV